MKEGITDTTMGINLKTWKYMDSALRNSSAQSQEMFQNRRKKIAAPVWKRLIPTNDIQCEFVSY